MDRTEECFQSLPEHWKKWIESWCKQRSNGKQNRLTATDFKPGSAVILRFEDGSFAQFAGAFYSHDQMRHELCVFTEHCGYHVFPDTNLEFSYMIWAQCPTAEEVDCEK